MRRSHIPHQHSETDRVDRRPGLALGIFAFVSLFAIAAPVRAVPPLETDDADATEFQQFEVYAGYEYLNQQHSSTRSLPALELDYGLADGLELACTTQYLSIGGANGYGDTTLELKYNFLKDPKKLPKMSVDLEWTLPTGSLSRGLGTGTAEYFFHAPVQKTWGKFTALADFGYTIVGEPALAGARDGRRNSWFIGFAQEYQVTKSINLLSEIYWETADERGDSNSLAATVGFEKEIVKDVTFQAAIGRSLREAANGGPDLRAYVGIHWVFDAPWKSGKDKDDKK